MRSVSAEMVTGSSAGELAAREGLVLSRKDEDSSPLTEVVVMSYIAGTESQPLALLSVQRIAKRRDRNWNASLELTSTAR
jgi:hypothetical protein